MKNAADQHQFLQVRTADGSATVISLLFNEKYHSDHGAMTESSHVYIRNGLGSLTFKDATVLELGFGTGLNALLACDHAISNQMRLNYVSYELFPLDEAWSEAALECLEDSRLTDLYRQILHAPWNERVSIAPEISLEKRCADIRELQDSERYDMVFYDAFSQRSQPELWTAGMFTLIHRSMKPGGGLVTYSCSGPVKRALKEAGFHIQRLKGPPGKKHMLRALKPL